LGIIGGTFGYYRWNIWVLTNRQKNPPALEPQGKADLSQNAIDIIDIIDIIASKPPLLT